MEENLRFFAGIYNVRGAQRQARIAWAVEMAGLRGREHLKTRELAGGWRQRLALGCAVLHEPPILFLDEPTSGVDPASRRNFWEMIGELSVARHHGVRHHALHGRGRALRRAGADLRRQAGRHRQPGNPQAPLHVAGVAGTRVQRFDGRVRRAQAGAGIGRCGAVRHHVASDRRRRSRSTRCGGGAAAGRRDQHPASGTHRAVTRGHLRRHCRSQRQQRRRAHERATPQTRHAGADGDCRSARSAPSCAGSSPTSGAIAAA